MIFSWIKDSVKAWKPTCFISLLLESEIIVLLCGYSCPITTLSLLHQTKIQNKLCTRMTMELSFLPSHGHDQVHPLQILSAQKPHWCWTPKAFDYCHEYLQHCCESKGIFLPQDVVGNTTKIRANQQVRAPKLQSLKTSTQVSLDVSHQSCCQVEKESIKSCTAFLDAAGDV